MYDVTGSAHVHLLTVVTPDLDASTGFYRDLLGYNLVQSGVLSPDAPLAEQAEGERRYAVLQPAGSGPGVRLIQTRQGGPANRPTGAAKAFDPGLAGLSVTVADDGATFMALKAAGIQTLSWPQFYRLPQAQGGDHSEFKTFTAIGPAGELVFVHRTLGAAPCEADGAVLVTRNRWPVFDAYAGLVGATPGPARHMLQAPYNTAIDAPPGAYFHFGALGGGLGWREYRSDPPLAAPPFPTALDRTGLAMISFAVQDLAKVRAAAGDRLLGEGALPDAAGREADAIYLRGPEGEVIEAVASGAGQ